jgi:hypothetical protein
LNLLQVRSSQLSSRWRTRSSQRCLQQCIFGDTSTHTHVTYLHSCFDHNSIWSNAWHETLRQTGSRLRKSEKTGLLLTLTV